MPSLPSGPDPHATAGPPQWFGWLPLGPGPPAYGEVGGGQYCLVQGVPGGVQAGALSSVGGVQTGWLQETPGAAELGAGAGDCGRRVGAPAHVGGEDTPSHHGGGAAGGGGGIC